MCAGGVYMPQRTLEQIAIEVRALGPMPQSRTRRRHEEVRSARREELEKYLLPSSEYDSLKRIWDSVPIVRVNRPDSEQVVMRAGGETWRFALVAIPRGCELTVSGVTVNLAKSAFGKLVWHTAAQCLLEEFTTRRAKTRY
jgi:hypothetical protein